MKEIILDSEKDVVIQKQQTMKASKVLVGSFIDSEKDQTVTAILAIPNKIQFNLLLWEGDNYNPDWTQQQAYDRIQELLQ